MTDTKALIAEARELADGIDDDELHESAALIRRLATALEEATPPEGWRVTRYDHPLGAIEYDEGGWHVGRCVADQLYIAWDANTYPTARAAMEALDGAAIDTSSGRALRAAGMKVVWDV